MGNKDYKKLIVEKMLKKYWNRVSKNSVHNRRIILKPTELYRLYDNNNADFNEKMNLNDAAEFFGKLEVIEIAYLKFSTDIEKMYLREDKVNVCSEYLHREYGITPKETVLSQTKGLLEKYVDSGGLVRYYCGLIRDRMEDPRTELVYAEIATNLKMLDFLDGNKEELYVREASMLVYGDSKWFEDNNYDIICSVVREALNMPIREDERNDSILLKFHIAPTDREIFIKGDWLIEWSDYTLDLSKLRGGVAITSGDVNLIKSVRVNAPKLMTIENKTSYQRMNLEGISTMYLGGFASREQILFLKKVINDNPHLQLYHFGDIDVGGFFIHRQLCRDTGADFALYQMGIGELNDSRYAGCIRVLTDNDLNRMETLMSDEVYEPVLKYMKEKNVKLEQEIISYYIMKLMH